MYEQNKLPVSLLVTTTTTFHMKCVYLFSSGFSKQISSKTKCVYYLICDRATNRNEI